MASLDLYLLTFNCGRTPIQPRVFAAYLFSKLPRQNGQPARLPNALVLNLQEVAPIGHCFLGRTFLKPYFNAFREAVRYATADHDEANTYINTITRNVGFTAIMVFVRDDFRDRVAWLETAGVGVGWCSDMGNKGAVGVRMGLRVEDVGNEIMEMAFVSAHFAPHEFAVEKRNGNWKEIVKGLVFTSIDTNENRRLPMVDEVENTPLLQGIPAHEGEDGGRLYGMFKPTSHLFFAGDLNYRTSRGRPLPQDYQLYPQPTTRRQNQQHYSHLLQNDQLMQEMREDRTLHGLTEPPIDFPPTYKYSTKGKRQPAQEDDVAQWPWSKEHWPSWCDRITYLDLPPWMRASQIRVNAYSALPLFLTTDHRPVMLSLTIPLKAIPHTATYEDPDVRWDPPFAIDSRWKEKRALARKKEVIAGILAYSVLTWEGNLLLLFTAIGAFLGWLAIKLVLSVSAPGHVSQ